MRFSMRREPLYQHMIEIMTMVHIFQNVYTSKPTSNVTSIKINVALCFGTKQRVV